MDDPQVPSFGQLGMFGLGGLGMPIAEHLARSFPVVGYDPARDAGGTAGLRLAATSEEVTASCETVLMCLPSPDVSIEVLSKIVGARARATRLVIELSTIGLAASARSSELCADASLGYLDAPVSGSIPRAATGDLTVMVAGLEREVARARPLLETIASHLFVLGERPGLGQVMKLANNIVNATAFAITSEAVVFGTRMGLDIAQMVEVLNVSTGRTSASVDKFPTSVVPRSFAYGARGEIVHKDAALFVKAARDVGLGPSVAVATEELWHRHVSAHPGLDFTNLYRFVEDEEVGNA